MQCSGSWGRSQRWRWTGLDLYRQLWSLAPSRLSRRDVCRRRRSGWSGRICSAVLRPPGLRLLPLSALLLIAISVIGGMVMKMHAVAVTLGLLLGPSFASLAAAQSPAAITQ